MNRRMLFCAVLLALVSAGATPAWAARTVRVYDVKVDSSGAAAFADAMRIALMRATGERGADQDPALQELMTNARRYAQVVRPVPGGTQISFDGSSLDRAIVAAGKSLWPRDRPVLLLIVDAATNDSAGGDWREAVQQIADERGLPLVIQSGSAALGNREAALAAARRAGADCALLAQPVGGRFDLKLWLPESLDARVSNTTWSGDLAAGIHGSADALAGSSIGLAVQPELETELAIAGIGGLRDYADVSRTLSGIAGVRSVVLLEIAAGSAVWRLTVRGGDETLQNALAVDARFNPAAGSSGRLAYAFRR